MSIKGRLVRAYAEANGKRVLHFAIKLLGIDEWNEADHPRDKDGKFSGSGSSGSSSSGSSGKMKEPETEYEQLQPVEDPDFDIFSWLEQEETEEQKAAREKREKAEAEEQKREQERNDYGQNGLSESEYPENLRLKKEEREQIMDIYRAYKDPNHKQTTPPDVSAALNGLLTENYIERKQNGYTDDLKEANEMIARRKAEGYSYKENHKNESSLARKKRWWDFYNEHGYAPEPEVGEKGIQHWQFQRKMALEGLKGLDLARKIVKRQEFAEKSGKYVPWRKNPNSENPNYRPWENDSFAEDGGPGSGNFNHAGRPGEVGGSAESEGGGSGSPESKYSKEIREIASNSRDYVDFWMSLPETEQKKFKSKEELKNAFEEIRASSTEETEEPEWKPANGTKADMPKTCKVPENLPEIKIVNNPNDTATAHAGKPGEIEINLANFDPENIDSVIAHEAAHQLSNNDPELQQAIIMNFGDVLGRYNQKKQHFDGIYGEYNPEEAFATGFSAYMNHPEHLKEHYPEAYEFFDAMAKNQPETIQYMQNAVQEAKKALKEQKNSAYREKLETERQDVLALPYNKQAQFANRSGIADRETCVEAMRNGTASDLVNRYFDIMEYNGDPTPTKPAKESPDMYSIVGKGGDWAGTRKKFIEDWAHMSPEEAEKTYQQLHTWFSNGWERADTKMLDDYIDRDGVFDGTIYRGLHFSFDDYDAFMKNAKPGGTISMMGMNSSWTTDREDAWNFSGGKDQRVVIKCIKNRTAAPVAHLSSQGEGEVLAHSKAQWTVLSVQEGVYGAYITVVERGEFMSDTERAELRKKHGLRALDSEEEEEGLEKRMNAQSKFFIATPPPADLFKETAEDGGPGSGNFGHKGRPGHVGGSGKGGGKQYRGGRSDIGYYGSRKDWLNGLKGERQMEAAKFIARMRMHYSQGAERDKTPEQNIMEEPRMKNGGNDTRAKLLEFISEARGWNEHASRLVNENWDENDKKLAAALADKYGRAFVGGAELPDESSTEEWEPEDLACWQDLKSKAMDGPTSGREVPEELQFAAGLKERPVPVANVPKWTQNANKENLSQIAYALSVASNKMIEPETLQDEEKRADLENKAFMNAVGNSLVDRPLKNYLLQKVALSGEGYLDSEEFHSRLTSEESERIKKEILIAKILNSNVISAQDHANREERLKVFAIINKGLGDADLVQKVEDAFEENKRKTREEQERREQARQEAARRAEEEAKKRDEENTRKRAEKLTNGISTASETAEESHVAKFPVQRASKIKTDDEIVSNVGGPDKTKGSCVSVSLAYIANKHGLDVRDFRGGKSEDVFAKRTTSIDLAESPGVDGIIVEELNDFVAAKQLFKSVEPGKEYMLSIGHHCAIVRKGEEGTLEYLELQGEKNGFRKMEGKNGEVTLKYRFACATRHRLFGQTVKYKSVLIDIDKLKNCKTFENMLPYINTNEGEQKKGAGGHEK